MKKSKKKFIEAVTIKPLRFLSLGIVMVMIGSIAKITGEEFYKKILLLGITVEIIGLVLFISKLNQFLMNPIKENQSN